MSSQGLKIMSLCVTYGVGTMQSWMVVVVSGNDDPVFVSSSTSTTVEEYDGLATTLRYSEAGATTRCSCGFYVLTVLREM